MLHHQAAGEFQLLDKANRRRTAVDLKLACADGDDAVGIGHTPKRGLKRRGEVVLFKDGGGGFAERRLGEIEAQRGAVSEEVIANVVDRLEFTNDGDVVAQLVGLEQCERIGSEVGIALADGETLLPDRLEQELAIVRPVRGARHRGQFLSVVGPGLLRDDEELVDRADVLHSGFVETAGQHVVSEGLQAHCRRFARRKAYGPAARSDRAGRNRRSPAEGNARQEADRSPDIAAQERWRDIR